MSGNRMARLSILSFAVLFVMACGKNLPIQGEWHPTPAGRVMKEGLTTITGDSITHTFKLDLLPSLNCKTMIPIRLSETEIEVQQNVERNGFCPGAKKGQVFTYTVQDDRLTLEPKSGDRNILIREYTRKK